MRALATGYLHAIVWRMKNIRPFDKEKDYPALVAFMNLYYSCSDYTEEGMRGLDSSGQLPRRRLLAEKDGAVIGHLIYMQEDDHPQKFWFRIDCADDAPERALYEAFVEAVAPDEPIELRGINMRERCSFFQSEGFVLTKRSWQANLDVEKFNPNTMQDIAERVLASGINIYSYAQLIGDPDRETKLYELDCLVDEAVHNSHPLPYTAPSLEKFKKDFLEDNPHLPHDAWFIAVEGDCKSGKYIGATAFTKPNEGNYFGIRYTGVLSEYRGRGIAYALKRHAVLYAKKNNISEICTAGANKVMLAINEKMGFVQQPAEIDIKKVLR